MPCNQAVSNQIITIYQTQQPNILTVDHTVVGDHFNICKGTVSTIFPRDSLQIMTDVHVYIDGMIPITYGQPIRLVGGEWFNSDNFNCIFIVGDDNGANLRRILGRFSDIEKRATEGFI
jgi:hypothetical protein